MRLSSKFQGALFAPALICLLFVLKAFCPDSAGESCFADQFAVPIFLPLVAMYRLFGDSSIVGGQELLLVFGYWAFVGFLVGLVVDLFFAHRRQAGIRAGSRPLETAPPVIMPTAATQPIVPSKPKPVPSPVVSAPSAPLAAAVPAAFIPKPVAHAAEAVSPKVVPIMKAMPLAPEHLPGAMIIPHLKDDPAPAKKPPINMLDRPEFQ